MSQLNSQPGQIKKMISIFTAGETAEFSCSVVGGRTDNLTWLKGNKPLDGQSDRIDTLASENGDEFTLRIRKCMETDSGTYTALAFNADGKSTCTAQLLVDRCEFCIIMLIFSVIHFLFTT